MDVLPKAIQAQLDQAEAIQQQLNAPAPEVETPEAAPVAEAPSDTQKAEQQVQPVQAPAATPDDTWEQRYRALDGKFRAEVPRLHEQLRETNARLETAMKALETAVERRSEQPKPETKLVTDADVESFGADLIDAIRRVAREEFSPLAAQLTQAIEQRIGAVAQRVESTEAQVVKTAEQTFWDTVIQTHADFDVINEDPRWFTFLDKRMPGTRYTRRQLAEDAIKNLDSAALIDQLQSFKAEVAPAPQVADPAPAAPTATTKPKPSLDSQVAPNSTRASTPSGDSPASAGRIWTGSEYVAALDHRNLQRMSREEYDALVAEADLALEEGRVRF